MFFGLPGTLHNILSVISTDSEVSHPFSGYSTSHTLFVELGDDSLLIGIITVVVLTTELEIPGSPWCQTQVTALFKFTGCGLCAWVLTTHSDGDPQYTGACY